MPELSKLEILALKGINAREREIQEKIAALAKPIQTDLSDIMVEIQARIKTTNPTFEFGKTHKLDIANLTLQPIEKPSEPDTSQ